MKKLRPVILAVIIGCTCAYFLFNEVENSTIREVNGNAVAIQIGVFTKEENALNMQKTYGGIITNDDGLYRVYYSILSKDDNIEFVTNYLRNEGINYYLKKITIDEEALDESEEYEKLMSSTSEKSKMTINDELLKMYEGVI